MADRYVSNSGTDTGAGGISAPWATLDYASLNATNGDTIYLKRGDTFAEPVKLTVAQAPTQESERITFDAYGTGADPIVAPGPDASIAITAVSAYEADEAGRTTITVAAGGMTGTENKFLYFASDVTVGTIKTVLSDTQVTVNGDFSGAAQSQAGGVYSIAGISISGKSYVTIQNLRFTDCVGCPLGAGAAVKFIGNTVDAIKASGGYVVECGMTDAASLVDSNIIKDCGPVICAIGHASGGSNITISNNIVNDIDGDGINLSTVTGTIIEKNTIGNVRSTAVGSQGHQDGIVVDPATDVIIRYNRIFNYSQGVYQDVHVSGGTIDGTQIYCNVFYVTTAYTLGTMAAIMLDGLHASAVIQNIAIYDNTFGDLGGTQSAVTIKTLAGGTYSNIVGRNNVFFSDRATPGASWTVGAQATAAVDLDYDICGGFTLYTADANNANGTSGAANPFDGYGGYLGSTFDFSISADSVLNNAGDPLLSTNVTLPATFLDISGTTRSKSGQTDVGAYETGAVTAGDPPAASGINGLFEACVTRFASIDALRAVGRKLSWVDQSTKPWTEFEVIGFDTEDGFGDDVEIHSIRFVYHGKSPTPDNASTWLEQMTAAFDDYTGLDVTGYTTVGINRLANSSPISREEGTGVFVAEVAYDVWLHRSVLVPAARGS